MKKELLIPFYNPANGQALTVDGHAPGDTSPNWALEDTKDFGDDQPFSYKKARQYFFKALTTTDKDERDKNWGLTFQTLGHVIHHLQDMSQPQHVRNDAHCDAVLGCMIPEYVFGLYSPSGYEKWTKAGPPADFSGFDGVWRLGSM